MSLSREELDRLAEREAADNGDAPLYIPPDPANDIPDVRGAKARERKRGKQAFENAGAVPPGSPRSDSTAGASAAEPPQGVAVILAYFHERYRPVFRRGNSIVCVDGTEVPMGVACSVPDSPLIERLAEAVDAPRYQGGGVKRHSLPSFFKTWSRVAWGDLIASLPDEDDAELGVDAPAAETFRRQVREAMLSEVVLGDVIGRINVTQTERRSLIDWCVKFAKPGPWRSIRSKKCWCKYVKLPGGELRLMVAIRHELFAQVHADRRLCEMGPHTFTLRAGRYGVGHSTREERPHGEAAVVLNPEFLAELTASLPDDSEDSPPEG